MSRAHPAPTATPNHYHPEAMTSPDLPRWYALLEADNAAAASRSRLEATPAPEDALPARLALLVAEADPVAGSYAGLVVAHPLRLEFELLRAVADITAAARAAGARADYHAAPVLGYLEDALDLPHMGATRRERLAPALLRNVSNAARDARDRILRGDPIPVVR